MSPPPLRGRVRAGGSLSTDIPRRSTLGATLHPTSLARGEGRMRESDYPRAKESRLSSLADFANLPPPTIWLRPIGLLRGSTAASAVASGAALPLAAGPLAFPLVETLALHNGRLVAAIASLAELRSGVMA